MMDKKWYFSFDAESAGLFGPVFAVGWVIVDQDNNELDQGYLAYPYLFSPEHHEWVIENVLPSLPCLPEDDRPKLGAQEWAYPTTYCNCTNELLMLVGFWNAWCAAKQEYPGITLVTDCPWPVESGFLHQVQQQVGFEMEDSPFPIIDIASARAAAGYDPLATCDRLPTEEPQHNPTNDARQSVRLLCSLQDELSGNRSLGISHGLYGPLMNLDGTPYEPDPPTFEYSDNPDGTATATLTYSGKP